MSLSAAEKARLVKEYGNSGTDTGSVEVQVALLTTDINKLTEHFKIHAKDFHSKQGLIRKVNLRRKLLAYLKITGIDRYTQLITRLNLRG
jgi:small subunit ribosomal protein S15